MINGCPVGYCTFTWLEAPPQIRGFLGTRKERRAHRLEAAGHWIGAGGTVCWRVGRLHSELLEAQTGAGSRASGLNR